MRSRINSFYIIVGVLFVTLLTVNTRYFKGSSAFLGVTYAKKYQINTEKSATVINSYVVPGQTVSTGDLLVELESPELELDIKKLEKEIQNLEIEKVEKQKLLESEVQLLESEKRIVQSDIDSEVQQIDSRITLNRALSEDLVNTNPRSDSLSTLQLQRRSTLEKGALEIEAINIRIKDIQQDHQFDQSQIQATIELAKQELDWRILEKEKLNKYALFDGIIDNVNIKPGEQVDSYTSLLSINPIHPTTVVGYLVGSKDRNRELGDIVLIRSMEQGYIETEGKIIGFGSVTDLPVILQKSTAVQAFGLEVFIEISENHDLPVGEKVMIK